MPPLFHIGKISRDQNTFISKYLYIKIPLLFVFCISSCHSLQSLFLLQCITFFINFLYFFTGNNTERIWWIIAEWCSVYDIWYHKCQGKKWCIFVPTRWQGAGSYINMNLYTGTAYWKYFNAWRNVPVWYWYFTAIEDLYSICFTVVRIYNNVKNVNYQTAGHTDIVLHEK